MVGNCGWLAVFYTIRKKFGGADFVTIEVSTAVELGINYFIT